VPGPEASSIEVTFERLVGVDLPAMLADEKHVLTILKTTMRVLGYSNRDVERRLELSGSYLSRLFSGDIDLRFSHIVNISRAMGLAPEEVLLLAYPPTQASKSEAARRLAASLEALEPKETLKETPAPRLTRQEQQMEEAVEEVVASMLGKLGSGPFGGLPGAAAGPELQPEPPSLPELPRRRRQGRKAKR
jgi:transcriptional regulator with XRE-family HTH domain